MNKVLTLILLIGTHTIQAEEIDFSAIVGLELRGFSQTTDSDTEANGVVSSMLFEPEVKWRSDDRKNRFSFVGFGRYDQQDSNRSHLDIREFYWSNNSGDWTTLIGINKIFWGVAESNHLIDVINQTDMVEDIDQEAKLGQPMVLISSQKDWGKIDMYLLPYFRERTFPSIDGRFNFGLDIADDAIYQSSNGKKNIDMAFRYSHYLGDVDFGVYYFNGTNREPRFMLNSDFSQLLPVYDQMSQIGIDIQYTKEAWLWKYESIFRHTDIDNFFAAVAGLEYTLYQINDSVADLGLLIEYQYDGRNAQSAPTIADNDLFLATRYAFNDSQDTSLLAGVVIDTDNNTTFFNIEAERRIGNNLKAELKIRALTNVDENDIAFAYEKDDYVQLSLNWYF